MKYPVYVISKGRHDCCFTADFLIKDKTPFKLVVEPHELELYAAKYDRNLIYTLPFSNLGLGGIPARNWCWENSIQQGHERHWILDDNIRDVKRRYKAFRVKCNSKIAFEACEDFVDRYENIAIAGMNYSMFVADKISMAPFYLNNHVYSCLLIMNSIPNRWRGRYNEDTDLCLQVLADGWCTILFNAFMINKMKTLMMKGGNATELYQGDGRLKMARSLERVWPYVVSVDRRFDRPQHKVRDEWRKFDTPLIRKKDIDFTKFEKVNEFGLELKQVAEEIKSEFIQNLLDGQRK